MGNPRWVFGKATRLYRNKDFLIYSKFSIKMVDFFAFQNFEKRMKFWTKLNIWKKNKEKKISLILLSFNLLSIDKIFFPKFLFFQNFYFSRFWFFAQFLFFKMFVFFYNFYFSRFWFFPKLLFFCQDFDFFQNFYFFQNFDFSIFYTILCFPKYIL